MSHSPGLWILWRKRQRVRVTKREKEREPWSPERGPTHTHGLNEAQENTPLTWAQEYGQVDVPVTDVFSCTSFSYIDSSS